MRSQFRDSDRSFQFLTGPSGAGKTSLLRLMLMSLQPTRGLISMFKHNTATLSKENRPICAAASALSFRIFGSSTI